MKYKHLKEIQNKFLNFYENTDSFSFIDYLVKNHQLSSISVSKLYKDLGIRLYWFSRLYSSYPYHYFRSKEYDMCITVGNSGLALRELDDNDIHIKLFSSISIIITYYEYGSGSFIDYPISKKHLTFYYDDRILLR